MKKLLILLFSILISFNSYGLFEKTVCVETDTQDRGDIIYLPNKSKPFTGKNLCEYENGQNESKGKVKDGKIVGKWTFWYENGLKISEGNFTSDGISETKEISYSQFIQSVNQGNVSTVKIAGSRITGLTSLGQKFETYSPGDLGLMGDLLKNGVSVQASPPGVQSENLIDAKKIGKWTYWHKNGQKYLEENYKDGKLDGKMTQWYENGQIKSEKNYKDGECISGDCD